MTGEKVSGEENQLFVQISCCNSRSRSRTRKRKSIIAPFYRDKGVLLRWYGSNEMHRVMEDKLMRQKARILLDEAASWSLLWHLYGKGNEELPEDLILLPTTSHLEACQFVVKNHTAQLCLRIVQWLEGLASKALDLDRKVRGSHVGTYLPSSGIWHHTQRFLKKGVSNPKTINHLDFDAPTREHAQQLPDDKSMLLQKKIDLIICVCVSMSISSWMIFRMV
ncbi:PREDICTED: nuclear pore complex protein NUP107-like, partial [Nicotiana attenuata]|uniref:nuclear pore complex protein NUP107-like n=1 Tax=Nicotiana attenuata TaxID=49451 RepID=UPI0009046D4E